MALSKSMQYGVLPIRLDGDQIADLPVGVLDTGRINYLTSNPGWKAELASEGITKRALYAAMPGMWVRDMTVKPLGDTAEIDISLEGILAGNGEKRQRKLSVFGSSISIGPLESVHIISQDEGVDPDGNSVTTKRRVPQLDNYGEVINKIITTPSGAADRWNILDPGVTVIDTYFITAAPNMTAVGTVMIPPSAPAVSAWLWGGYSEPKRGNFPSGWVLANREPEQLYGFVLGGVGLWKITDTYEYYYPSNPD